MGCFIPEDDKDAWGDDCSSNEESDNEDDDDDMVVGAFYQVFSARWPKRHNPMDESCAER